MARDVAAEKEADLGRLDRALDRIDAILRAKAPEDAHPTYVDALDANQLKAIDRIVPLLERRSKLLGLDATPDSKAPGAASQDPDGPIVKAIRSEGDNVRLVK